ncbi:MAG: hypothetical protein ACR2L2_12180 [Acidobacteriota bacterium]
MRKLFLGLTILLCTCSSSAVGQKGGSLNQVFQYLALYWGAATYSQNYQKLFLGQNPRILLLTPEAMLGLLEQLCKKASVHCSPHPEHVLGKSLPDGRIAVVHGVVHPLYEALYIIHELEHYRDDPQQSAAASEIRARTIERHFMERVFGERWYNETTRLLARRCETIAVGNYIYLDPTEEAIFALRQQLRRVAVETPLNEQQKGALRNSVMFLANSHQTLTHPLFLVAFRAGYRK